MTLSLPFALVFSLISCSLSGSSENDSTSRNASKSLFTGEYSDVLYNLYTSVKNDEIASTIADGELSEQDMNDIENIFITCMREKNWIVTFNSSGGSDISSTNPNAELDSDAELNAEMACNQDTSLPSFQTLFDSIQNNIPNYKSEDEKNEARVVCLKRKNIVPEDYTVDDYNFDWGHTSPDKKPHGPLEPFVTNWSAHDEQSEIFWNCQHNPNS